MKKFKSWIVVSIIGIFLISFFTFSGCREPEVVVETVVKTVIETVVETVVETVIETVEIEKEIIEEPSKEEIIEEPSKEESVEKPTGETGPVQNEETESIILNGSGDSIVDIDKPNVPMVVHIVGNSSSGYFGVTSYDKEGEYLDLLVNTAEPYDGIRTLDFLPGEWTSRFEVKSTDTWIIEILPISSIRVLSVPGKIEGKDDEVLKISGGVPDLAKISGNDSGGYFGIFTYNGFEDLIVNETDPYEGTVMLDREITFIEVKAVGNWSIEITTK